MQFPTPALVCLAPPQAIQLCVQFPGGVSVCANDLLAAADPFMVIQTLFQAINAALAPLQPIFDIIDAVDALVKCVQAIPQCIATLDPAPLVDCIPGLAQALAKLLALVPALSVPIMVLEFIKALIVAISAFIGRLEAVILKDAQLLAAATKAAQPGNIALRSVVNCATGNLAVDILNLNAALGPLNQLIGIVNLLASAVPGLPNPLIPNLNNLGVDALKAIQPLQEVVAVLTEIASAIPVP
jgi:hypothetical protein